MDPKLSDFVESKGKVAADAAVEKFRERTPNFQDSWKGPMMYASGFTAARLAKAMSVEWITPLRRQVRIAWMSAALSLALLAAGLFYLWSAVSFTTFATFLVTFAPAVAALAYSTAKSYKAWAEARKALAEAKAIESPTGSNSGTR